MDRYRIAPGAAVKLAEMDPGDTSAFDGDKAAGQERTAELVGELEALQNLLYADASHRLLVVVQATDTGGKDGLIRKVFDRVNPQGVKVTSFKKPTEPELAHDYLWRVHPHVPGDGEIAIFNRSHYEDVLIVRVHELVPEERWRRRFQQIRDFERMLVEEGTTILKFFLHISKDEQAERLQARLDDPKKRWKFQTADLDERKYWDAYEEAFEELLTETSTAEAPWYCIPANRKWYRDLVAATVLVDTLQGMDLQWPSPPDLDGIVIE